jgi:cyclophilin family peptidyl-prolyl cis-trans isomerase
MRNRTRPLFDLLVLAALASAVRAVATPAQAGASATPARPTPARAIDASRWDVAIETTEGRFTIRLYPADAPKTAANFVKLVAQGFYDSLTFHRVVPGFVLQGGDPNSRDENPFNDGQGGPGYTIPAEIKRKHEKGAVAMARKPDVANPARESSGSQFYIALNDLPQLDGSYTVFGKVISGWDTIDRLVALAARTDIARVGNNANPGKLALIRHARLVPRAQRSGRGAAVTGARPKH